jgi:hypothetical protein
VRTEWWPRLRFVVGLGLVTALMGASTASCSKNTAQPACTDGWAGTSVALTHLAPLARLDLGSVGYCADDPVTVRFATGGETIDVGATSAEPLQVIVPPWFDPGTGAVGNLDATVTVVGLDGAHPLPGTLHIDALAPDPSGAPPGSRSLAVLRDVTSAVTDARSRLSAFRGDTSALDSSFATALAGLSALTSSIQQLQSSGTPVPLVTLPSGATAPLAPASLSTLDALFVATLGPGAGAAQSSAATAADDPAWFQNMVKDVAQGSLDSARDFNGRVGSFIAVLAVGAAVLGAEAAAAPLAVAGAVLYAATTFAPAASALIVDFAASAVGDGPDGPTSEEAWQTAAPALQYVVLETVSQAVAESAQTAIEPASPTGAAAYGAIDSQVGISDGVAQKVVNVIWGKDAKCPGGAVPSEISFNPDSVTCPQPISPGGGSSGASSGSSSSGGAAGDNVCLQGGGVAADPTFWTQLCHAVSAKSSGMPRTNFLDCFPANPSYGVPAPTLSDGSQPSQECVQVHDADGMLVNGSGIGGCDDPTVETCWCCP